MNARGQSKKVFRLLDNEKYKYVASRTMMRIVDTGIILPRTVIKGKLSLNQKRKLLQLPKEAWLCLLKDSSTDWAANLFLYEIAGRDAFLNSGIVEDPIAYWRLCCRKEDIEYWQIFLDNIASGELGRMLSSQ